MAEKEPSNRKAELEKKRKELSGHIAALQVEVGGFQQQEEILNLQIKELNDRKSELYKNMAARSGREEAARKELKEVEEELKSLNSE